VKDPKLVKDPKRSFNLGHKPAKYRREQWVEVVCGDLSP